MAMMLCLVFVSLGAVASGGRFARLSTPSRPPPSSEAQALVRVEEALDTTEKKKKKKWSPIMSSARSIYRRTPMLSAVSAMRPQAAVVASAVGVCATRVRRHLNVPTAGFLSLALLPVEAQRASIRALALCAAARACWMTATEARLEAMALPIGTERFALVTGVGGGLGASAARALAARGFGLVLVGANEQETQTLARRLRVEFGSRCITVGKAELNVAAALEERGVVDRLRDRLKQANVQLDVLCIVHANSPQPTPTIVEQQPEEQEQQEEAVFQSTTLAPQQQDVDAGVLASRVVQARCAEATDLALAFGEDMSRRGRGRCVFVVDGEAAAEQLNDPMARHALAASDAYVLALASSLRRDLARSGVGVTVARRRRSLQCLLTRDRLPLWSHTPSAPSAPPPDDEQLISPGERLVDATLRGDALVWYHD